MLTVQPTLSIIIPVYNVADYLSASILSVLNQSFSDFELILVDDGSTDLSGEICDAYALSDDRIRVFHQPNGGVAAARNTGIEAATGLFVGFVDGDDWIEPDLYELLYKNSLAYDAEISACGFIKVSDRNRMAFTSPLKPTQVFSSEEALKAMFTQNHLRYSACNKLFKRTLFESVRYPVGKWIEDKRTTYRLLDLCQRVAWCPTKKYHYYLRPNSISHTECREKYIDFFEANDELMTFIATHYPRLKRVVGACYSAECLRILEKMRSSGYEDAFVREKCMNYIQDHWKYSFITSTMDFQTKLKIAKFLLQANRLRSKK